MNAVTNSNTNTAADREQARAELGGMLIQGAVSLSTSLFCGLLDGMAQMADEKRAADKAERRELLRGQILSGKRMRLWEMAATMKRINVSVKEVAEFTGLSTATVKKAVRRWYMFS